MILPNALEFKQMLGTDLSEKESAALQNAQNYYSDTANQLTLDKGFQQSK